MGIFAEKFRIIAGLLCASGLVAGCGGGGEDDGYSSPSSASTSSGSSSSASGASKGGDALDYSQVAYKYSCQGVPGTKSIDVSNGPCITQQKAYAKATTCNELDSNNSFNTVGKAFYSCLVNNSSDSKIKAYYQQNLSAYSR